MNGIAEKMALLHGADHQAGHRALQELQRASDCSSAVFDSYFEELAAMLDSDNAYRRVRAMVLLAANSRWDAQNKLDALLDRFLSHITDEKPIAARQCIQTLPTLARHKPALRAEIVFALQNADTSIYKDSMWPLVEKDIAQALKEIHAL